jgi:peroxiredoxin Q/BCP
MTTTLEGGKAPGFKLPDAKGNDVSLADLAGRDVILYFYPADDTPGCTAEACGFRDVWAEIKKAGAVVIGVSPDPPESHRKFATKYELPFTLLADPKAAVLKKYGAWGSKVLFGRKVTGVIRSTVWIGPDGRVKKHWPRIPNAARHPEAVLREMSSTASPGRRSSPRR